MSHPIKHSENAVRKWGGVMEDYLPIHEWFDESKSVIADWRHRALRHHTFGIFEAEKRFGPYIVNSDGKKVPTRYIGEQHVMEDLGWIPTPQDYLECMPIEKWMGKVGSKKQKSTLREVPLMSEDELQTLFAEFQHDMNMTPSN